jgi:hypothetical protein
VSALLRQLASLYPIRPGGEKRKPGPVRLPRFGTHPGTLKIPPVCRSAQRGPPPCGPTLRLREQRRRTPVRDKDFGL